MTKPCKEVFWACLLMLRCSLAVCAHIAADDGLTAVRHIDPLDYDFLCFVSMLAVIKPHQLGIDPEELESLLEVKFPELFRPDILIP